MLLTLRGGAPQAWGARETLTNTTHSPSLCPSLPARTAHAASVLRLAGPSQVPPHALQAQSVKQGLPVPSPEQVGTWPHLGPLSDLLLRRVCWPPTPEKDVLESCGPRFPRELNSTSGLQEPHGLRSPAPASLFSARGDGDQERSSCFLITNVGTVPQADHAHPHPSSLRLLLLLFTDTDIISPLNQD